ncbi:MAG TPA: glycosyltransferase family 1 protein [Rhodanobacteraceae bacterium]|nr:glycosyltransferase family 1 protein [Rhodanobacteraceae bacterium]
MSEKQRSTSEKSRRELLDELYYLRDVAGEREQRILRLEAALMQTGEERAQRIAQLEAELAAAHAAVATMVGSRSWRMTAPLRALTRWFSKEKAGDLDASIDHTVEPAVSQGSEIYPAEPIRAVTAEASKLSGCETSLPRERDGIPRFYVDATEVILREGRTGIQRVVRGILRSLSESPPAGYNVEPVYAAPGQSYRAAMASADGRLVRGTSPLAIEIRPGDVFLGLDHAMEAVVEHASEFEAVKKDGARFYFLCNDTLPLSRPDWFPPQVHELFKAWLTTIARVGDGIICISRATESELRRWLDELQIQRETPLLLGHFHLGADIATPARENHTWSAEQRSALKHLGNIPSFLLVGTLEPRKGHAQALEAFELLWQRGQQVALVLVGFQGWMTEVTARRIRHHDEFNHRLFWFMGADDEFLEELYRKCTALLAPSEGEGFGLPLIEAARHGLPILCRDIPVFREVAGEHATYFSGFDPQPLANAIRDWLKQRARDGVAESNRMRWLTWGQSARQLLDVLLGGQWDESWTGPRELPSETRSH